MVATPTASAASADASLVRKGKAEAYNLWRKGFISNDRELREELQRVLDELVSGLDMDPQLDVHVYVVRRPELNAFAMPDGSLFVNVGLLAAMDSMDEVAFVLAHEVHHAVALHMQRSFDDFQSKQRLFSVLSMFGAMTAGRVGGSDLAAMAVNYATQYGIGLVAAYAVNGYGRELESEADRAAVAALERTGREGCAAAYALRAMLEEGKDRNRIANLFWGSHPLIRERIESVQEILGNECETEPVVTSLDGDWVRSPSAEAAVDYAHIKWPMTKRRAELWRLTGYWRQALEAAEAYARVFPKDPDAKVIIGDSYRAIAALAGGDAGDTPSGTGSGPDGGAAADTLRLAFDSYAWAIDLAAEDYRAPLRGIALTAEAAGDTAAAIAYWQRYVAGDAHVPHRRAAQHRLGELRRAFGRVVDDDAHRTIDFSGREEEAGDDS